MWYGILAIVAFVGIVVVFALLADPMGIGRTVNRSFTRGLGSIFGRRASSSDGAPRL